MRTAPQRGTAKQTTIQYTVSIHCCCFCHFVSCDSNVCLIVLDPSLCMHSPTPSASSRSLFHGQLLISMPHRYIYCNMRLRIHVWSSLLASLCLYPLRLCSSIVRSIRNFAIKRQHNIHTLRHSNLFRAQPKRFPSTLLFVQIVKYVGRVCIFQFSLLFQSAPHISKMYLCVVCDILFIATK